MTVHEKSATTCHGLSVLMDGRSLNVLAAARASVTAIHSFYGKGKNIMAVDQSLIEEQKLREDRLAALTALAVQPAAAPAAHLAEEDLAAFCEGRLDATHRERILTHLDACSDCYDEWLAVTEVLDGYLTPITQPEPETPLPSRHWWRAIQSWVARALDSYRHARPILWSGAAVAACLLVLLVAPWHTDSGLPTLIEQSYENAQANSMAALRETAARQTLPWEGSAPVYGFSAATGSEAARAFGAGLWEGRRALAGDDRSAALPAFLAPIPGPSATSSTWRNTEWADYASLGRWVVLLQTVCRTPQAGSPTFWDQQRAVAAELIKRLARRPTTDLQAPPVMRVMQDLEGALNDANLAANDHRLCLQIERNCIRLSSLLAPERQ